MIGFISTFLQVTIPTDYDTIKIVTGMLISIGIGILVGLEREHSHKLDKKAGGTDLLFAGIRTYPLITLLGFLMMFLSGLLTIWLFIITLTGILSFLGIFYYRNSKRGHTGTTSEFAVIISYLLGGLVYLDYIMLAVGIGVLLTLALAVKVRLHKAVWKLSQEDIYAFIKFTIMAALILPLLPDEEFGPEGVLNPRGIGLIIVLLTALNFVGYLLAKFIDTEKSIILTGILGGLLSSTAVTWYFSRKSKGLKTGAEYQSVAIITASSIMFLRVAILLYILNMTLFFETVVGMILVTVIGLGIGFFIVKNTTSKRVGDVMPSKNPLNLTEALKFAAIYTTILLLVGFAKQYIGSSAVYAVSAVSGLTDVDAVVISMANLGGSALDMNVALTGIIIALASNTLVKYGMCLTFGSPKLKKFTSYGFIPIFLAFALYVVIKRAFF